MISVLKSKIKRAVITQSEMDYEGSITLDVGFMALANIKPYERVDVNNRTNGKRFTTYVLPGKMGSGIIALNGAASLCGEVGDEIHINSYGYISETDDEPYKPVIVDIYE